MNMAFSWTWLHLKQRKNEDRLSSSCHMLWYFLIKTVKYNCWKIQSLWCKKWPQSYHWLQALSIMTKLTWYYCTAYLQVESRSMDWMSVPKSLVYVPFWRCSSQFCTNKENEAKYSRLPHNYTYTFKLVWLQT